MAVSSSRYTTTEGLDTSVQNMEESRSAFQELPPQTLGMPAQRTAQMPVPSAGPLPTQLWGQPSAPIPERPERPKFGTFSELYQLYQLYALLASQITIYILTYLYVRVYNFNFLSYS